MNTLLRVALVSSVIIAIPAVASAHQRQAFLIGDIAYTFVIGSLNEPVFVDDKTGVELRIRLADPQDPTNFSSPNLKPVEKLETSLKVEIAAGDKTQIFDLEPAFRDPGAYHAAFFPTVATTYTYRVFGELDSTAVNLSFTCNPAGHPQTKEDTTEVEISDDVTRIFNAGSFGCPRDRGAVQFPEKATTNYEQTKQLASITGVSNAWVYGSLLVSLIALGVALSARRKR